MNRDRKMRRRRIALAGWLAVIAAGVCVGCRDREIRDAAPVPVTVYRTPTPATGKAQLYSATLVPYTQVELAFQIGGYVESIAQIPAPGGGTRDVQAGDPIRAGEALARLQDATYRAQVEQASQQLAASRASFAEASEDFSRNERLRERDFVSQSDFEASREAYQSSRAQLIDARTDVWSAYAQLGYATGEPPTP